MSNINALDVPSSFRGDIFMQGAVAPAPCSTWKVILDRSLVVITVSIVGVFLLSVLHPSHFALTAAFGLAGLWATKRLSSDSAYKVAPFLVALNLVAWPEEVIALPVAALTIGLALEFPVDECLREAMRLSGLTGAAITLLCMLVG